MCTYKGLSRALDDFLQNVKQRAYNASFDEISHRKTIIPFLERDTAKLFSFLRRVMQGDYVPFHKV